MAYAFNTTMNISFDRAIEEVTKALQKEGFGIITKVNLDEKFKEKLNVAYHRYTILGACSPSHALKAVEKEELIGLMLPCNVVVIEKGAEVTLVAAIDPVASMASVENQGLADVASDVRSRLQRVIESLA